MKKKKVQSSGVYELMYAHGGVSGSVSGDTMQECVDKITSFGQLKGFVMLTASKNGVVNSIRLYPLQARRFLISKVYKQILAKRFTVALK